MSFKKAFTRFLGLAGTMALLLGGAAWYATADETAPPRLTITPKMLRFTYQGFEGDNYFPCTHALESAEAQDWKLICKNPNGPGTRQFRIHLWVTAYTHTNAPKLSYEILYWVTDLSDSAHIVAVGGTTWLHLSEPSALAGIELSQSVENDTAGVYLKLNPATP